MKHLAIVLTAATALAMAPGLARAATFEEASARFAAKLQAAEAAGHSTQAQATYGEGSQLIASPFNGATCPNRKTP